MAHTNITIAQALPAERLVAVETFFFTAGCRWRRPLRKATTLWTVRCVLSLSPRIIHYFMAPNSLSVTQPLTPHADSSAPLANFPQECSARANEPSWPDYGDSFASEISLPSETDTEEPKTPKQRPTKIASTLPTLRLDSRCNGKDCKCCPIEWWRLREAKEARELAKTRARRARSGECVDCGFDAGVCRCKERQRPSLVLAEALPASLRWSQFLYRGRA